MVGTKQRGGRRVGDDGRPAPRASQWQDGRVGGPTERVGGFSIRAAWEELVVSGSCWVAEWVARTERRSRERDEIKDERRADKRRFSRFKAQYAAC